jgi:hypothetical protein
MLLAFSAGERTKESNRKSNKKSYKVKTNVFFSSTKLLVFGSKPCGNMTLPTMGKSAIVSELSGIVIFSIKGHTILMLGNSFP